MRMLSNRKHVSGYFNLNVNIYVNSVNNLAYFLSKLLF